tara:strand:+ start:930 stop:2678 length:1749 start_codon:yes stop_codon:yes gene_type:complete
MSTQIFIKNGLCKPEYTKIAAHSFSFVPNFIEPVLYSGGNNGPNGQATWSRDNFDYKNTILAPSILESDKTVGIPLPINLVSDDVVTLSGTVYFNNPKQYIIAGYDVSLILGVYYFNCIDKNSIDGSSQGYTFIPIESFVFDTNPLCFATSVTLGSNFDIHDTRFLVGFNIEIQCPTMCLDPDLTDNLVTVSYTFDIERPCAASPDNFIIQNCCEPLITELVHIPGLTVGSFHVDDEGNCWEVMSISTDVTNFTRNFIDIYTSCVECQTANPCPQNLFIESCCVLGKEIVTGSLPGLNIGDTFVDNNGLCWFVNSETGAPLSEESITVVTEIIGACLACTAANPCPDFWSIQSCCGNLKETIATTVTLNIGDSFVDTNGICWSVDLPATSLPTNYGIVVDTVYSVTPDTNCDLCKTANPCPLEYFLTVRACCDPDRIEVISVPANNMVFTEGFIFRDSYSVCWEVMSYSTTGVETYPIDWLSARFGIYEDCYNCTGGGRKPICVLLYQVRDCNTDIIYTSSVVNGLLVVGSYYTGTVMPPLGLSYKSCFEILGYGYPTIDPLEVNIQATATQFATCEECNAV